MNSGHDVFEDIDLTLSAVDHRFGREVAAELVTFTFHCFVSLHHACQPRLSEEMAQA